MRLMQVKDGKGVVGTVEIRLRMRKGVGEVGVGEGRGGVVGAVGVSETRGGAVSAIHAGKGREAIAASAGMVFVGEGKYGGRFVGCGICCLSTKRGCRCGRCS